MEQLCEVLIKLSALINIAYTAYFRNVYGWLWLMYTFSSVTLRLYYTIHYGVWLKSKISGMFMKTQNKQTKTNEQTKAKQQQQQKQNKNKQANKQTNKPPLQPTNQQTNKQTYDIIWYQNLWKD